MMTCAHVRPLLSAYFDRELDAAKSLEIEDHARACKACSAVLQQHEALRAALAATPLVFAPPKGLERRVRSTVRRGAGFQLASLLPPWRWATVPLAAALVAVLSWRAAVHTIGISGEDAILPELVSAHIRSLMVDHLVDVATSDQHTVKPWFNGKVDFAPPVTDLTASGFPLIGGRMDYIGGRPVAVVVYKRRQHVVNVFIWPSRSGDDQSPRPLAFQGYHLLRWKRSNLTFWAVSDVNSSDLQTLANLLREAG